MVCEKNAHLDTGLGKSLEEDLSVDSEHGASLLGLCNDFFDSVSQQQPNHPLSERRPTTNCVKQKNGRSSDRQFHRAQPAPHGGAA